MRGDGGVSEAAALAARLRGERPGRDANPPALVESDTGLICLVLLFKYLDRPVDPQQIRHQYGQQGKPLTHTDMLRCAKQLGVKARLVHSKWNRLAKLPLPVMARAKDGRWFIIAKVDDTRALLHDPIQARPVPVDKADLIAQWTGEVIMMTTRETTAGDRRSFDFTWFIPAIVKFRRLFGEVLFASFWLQIFALISPIFFQVVVDKVLVHKGFSTLDVLVAGLVVVTVFETLLSGLRTYVFSHTTNRVDVELGARLFKHLLNLPLAYFQVRRVGQSVARVRELETIRSFLTGSALTLVIDLLFTVVFIAVMFVYSATLSWIIIASIPIFGLITVVISPILRKRLEEKFNRGAENQAFLVESVTGIETVKAMAVEPQMQRRWEEQLAGYVSANFKVNNVANIGSHLIQFVTKAVTAATLWFGAHLVIDNALTVGQFIAFNMLAGRVTGPILRLAQMWQDFQQVRISVARLGDILNTPAEPAYKPGRIALPPIKGDIELDRVVFRYRPDGPEIVRGLSLKVPAGQVLGIVGTSGSGKSTLAKLLQRLYVPESGRVLIDGVDLGMIDPSWLRRQIGVVPQDSILFNRSVRDNIALSDRTVPMERIVAAAKLAGAHEFILQLSEGYDTEIEERGHNLSGGQRQRIAIARALLSQPRILIFDEATSALDAESEELIQENMRQIVAGRTVIIVAHRLSALRIADRIVSVDRGQIVEDGTPAELLRRAGPFARFYRKQLMSMVDREAS